MTVPASQTLRVAALQLNAGAEKGENIRRAGELVAEAAAGGAQLAVLPEKWTGLGSPEILRSSAEDLESGEAVAAMREWARDLGIHLVGGSITERGEDGDLYNTSLVIDPEGERIATYRKIHLFDVDVAGQRYRESEVENAGREIVTVEVEGWTLGLTICYDLRFPELYRILALRGAEVLVVPAAFTFVTGRDHWELLLRARALENQCFAVGADDWGEHPEGKRTYGRSMIVDPWGMVLSQLADGDGIAHADLDRSRLSEVRSAIPALANRKPEAYRWPDQEPHLPASTARP